MVVVVVPAAANAVLVLGALSHGLTTCAFLFFRLRRQIGRHVMRGCAEVLKPVVLELGGKDPVIVCEDADFDQVFAYAMRGSYAQPCA